MHQLFCQALLSRDIQEKLQCSCSPKALEGERGDDVLVVDQSVVVVHVGVIPRGRCRIEHPRRPSRHHLNLRLHTTHTMFFSFQGRLSLQVCSPHAHMLAIQCNKRSVSRGELMVKKTHIGEGRLSPGPTEGSQRCPKTEPAAEHPAPEHG